MKREEINKYNKKLKGAIMASGYTKNEMAKKLELNAASFSHKLNGKREFKLNEVKKILKIIGKTFDDIFGYELNEKESDVDQKTQ